MKANPGSGRIWNIIVHLEGLPPIGQEIFAASIFSGVSSGQRLQQNSARTADTVTAALSSCSSVKFPNVYRLLTILERCT